ncbi:MAG TPA: small multi-drug export protein [Sphaerochaeta sp.]|nr:small multi-drug export protein [Sphaerochaeta sp.]
MSTADLFISILLALAPISELRGAIPYAYFRGAPLVQAALLGAGFNALIAPIAYAFLSTLHRFFYRHLAWYVSLFDRFVERARRKVEAKVERYGYWGIFLFVAVPLPFTGAWTGTLGAWVLGLDKKRSLLAVFGGVMLSALIVTAIIALGFTETSIFIKHF